MGRSRIRSSDLGALLLVVAIVALPLARGGVDVAAECVATVLSVLALLLASRRHPAVPTPALPLLAVVAIGVLQLVPVPPVVHSVSPGASRVFEISLAPLGLYPGVRPLSLDVAASVRELSKACAYTAAFWAAWAYSRASRMHAHVITALAASGAAVAACVLGLSPVLNGELLASQAPFVNPNHLAGFHNLTAFPALGLALRTRGRTRALWAMAFVVGGAGVFLSLSRGAIAAFLVGVALFVVFRLRRHASGDRHAWSSVIIAGVVAAAAGVALYVAADPIVAELRSLRGVANDTKLRLLAPAAAVIRDYPLVGTGAGAFPSVFPAYQSESGAVTFTHVENEWVQPLVDFGVPGGLLLVGTFVWVWMSAARRRDVTPSEAGLLAGTAALATHNLVDFSLAVTGVALPFAIAMGNLASKQRSIPVNVRLVRAGVAVGILVAFASLWMTFAHDLDRDRDRVECAQGAEATGHAARSALTWHPADWYPHAQAGVRVASERSCRDGLAWLLRAMALNPVAPEPHLATARCLAGSNDAAAKREYRLAIAFGSAALPEAAARYPKLGDLLEIAPATPDGLLALGSALFEGGRTADAEAVFVRLLHDFGDARAVLPLAFARSRLGKPAEALALARQFSRARADAPDGWLLAAKSLVELGREDEARAEIEKGLAATPGSVALLGFLAERAFHARRWSDAKRIGEQIAPRSPAELVSKHLIGARALAGQGRFLEALEMARSAAAADDAARSPWVMIAEYSAELERFAEAIEALRHGATLPGAPADGYASRIAELESARLRATERARQHRLLSEPADTGHGDQP